ncbi:uncharacterized protein LOC114256967 [Camellia sinensis]|uniref:uncharacterized protein LOC114256967 n=1 Tax=Camellia sinensis TaxID=4442 RepID=UPI001036C3F5|nr:uncharacterized protein LOC114256967 [Camellia sinensis]XP_028052469.1 uncharacterized protein LOC114256967 [Camellia sinensis]
MRSVGGLTPRKAEDLMLGIDAVLFLEEGDYATYRHTYLMPPLSGVRTPRRRAADMPSSNRARAGDIPLTSGAGTSRGGTRGMSLTWQCVGWPDLSTELTGWQYGTPYQIPLEPPLPDHRYISDPDSPPPPREYIEGLLGVVASLEGMALRRETLLHSYSIPVAPVQPGPSQPSRAARTGASTRGRGRRRAPVSYDEESSEEEKSAHSQSETSACRDDSSGSDSEGGGDTEEATEDGGSDLDGDADDGGAEAAQSKRVKRASRS